MPSYPLPLFLFSEDDPVSRARFDSSIKSPSESSSSWFSITFSFSFGFGFCFFGFGILAGTFGLFCLGNSDLIFGLGFLNIFEISLLGEWDSALSESVRDLDTREAACSLTRSFVVSSSGDLKLDGLKFLFEVR